MHSRKNINKEFNFHIKLRCANLTFHFEAGTISVYGLFKKNDHELRVLKLIILKKVRTFIMHRKQTMDTIRLYSPSTFNVIVKQEELIYLITVLFAELLRLEMGHQMPSELPGPVPNLGEDSGIQKKNPRVPKAISTIVWRITLCVMYINIFIVLYYYGARVV